MVCLYKAYFYYKKGRNTRQYKNNFLTKHMSYNCCKLLHITRGKYASFYEGQKSNEALLPCDGLRLGKSLGKFKGRI